MLLLVVSIAVLSNLSPAIAATVQSEQKIKVIRPDEGRILALGQDFNTLSKRSHTSKNKILVRS